MLGQPLLVALRLFPMSSYVGFQHSIDARLISLSAGAEVIQDLRVQPDRDHLLWLWQLDDLGRAVAAEPDGHDASVRIHVQALNAIPPDPVEDPRQVDVERRGARESDGVARGDPARRPGRTFPAVPTKSAARPPPPPTSQRPPLRPAARLVLCDDFLAGPADTPDVREFQRGWHASSLLEPKRVDAIAAVSGLTLVDDRDFTPFLELDRPRDRVLGAVVALGRPAFGHTKRWLSLSGGHALRQCLKQGAVQYRYRVWQKV